MSIINRHGPCLGITLFRIGQRRAEIWFCPANYTIEEHTHKQEDVELMFLFGRCNFWRRDILSNKVDKVYVTTLRNFGKRFSVKHYHSHWFSVTNWPLVFINFQRFLNGVEPKSAAEDFTLTEY